MSSISWVRWLGVDRTDRESSFCAVAMQTPDTPMVVPDTHTDPRFAANRLVVGDPGIRAYIGVPLLAAEGTPLGAVCALGDQPQAVTAEQLDALRSLGRIIEQLLQAQRTMTLLRETQRAERASREQFRMVFDLATIGMTLLDDKGLYVRVNKAFADMLGHPVSDIVGRSFRDFVDGDGEAQQPAVRDMFAGVRRTALWEASYRHRDGSSVPALVTSSLIRPDGDESWLALNHVESLVERRAAETRLTELHSAVDGIISIDERGIVVAWNAGAERMLGYPAAQMLGRPLHRIIPAELGDAHEALVARVSAGLPPLLSDETIEVSVLHADGHPLPIELSLSSWEHEGLPRYTAILRDISERRRNQLHAELVRHAASTANNSDYFPAAASSVMREVCEKLGWLAAHTWTAGDNDEWYVSAHPHSGDATCALRELAAVPVGPKPGRPLVGAQTHMNSGPEELRDLAACVDSCHLGTAVAVPVLAGGEATGMLAFFLPVSAGTPPAQLVVDLEQIGLSLGRVVERQRTAAVLVYQANHDPVTDLANRRRLLERIDEVRERLRSDTGATHLGAVLLLNLDRFRVVNDSLGYAAGDQVLREVAARLRRSVPDADAIARLGADEFVVLVHRRIAADTDPESALLPLAGKVLRALASTVEVAGLYVTLRASVGIRVLTGRDAGGPTFPAGVLRDADAALRQAKRRGRGQVQLYDAALRSTAAERTADESALSAGIGAGQLLLHHQPIVSLDTGMPVGTEALVRWARPGHGLVYPDRFIALAEESGLIVDLGRWVLRQACRDAVAWSRTAPPLAGATVSVNVSTRQLVHPGFLHDLDEALAECALPATRLTLEITESALIQEPEAVLATLHAVRARGVRLALDDFGTGYSSLSYVQHLPVSILKIDKSFVDPITAPGQGTTLSEVVLKLAEATGLLTVAEGVESHHQADALRRLGCDRGQGYVWSRPVPAHRLGAVVAGLGTGDTT